MWCLETRKGRVFVLAHLPAVVGSRAGADVLLRHPSIAPRHARFEQDDEGALHVEALDEAVVGVERRRVRRARVRDGHELVLGKLAFTLVRLEDGPPAAVPRAERGDDDLMRGLQLRGGRPARAAARAAGGEGELKLRHRTLQFHRVEQRPGLLGADLSQLPATSKLLLALGAVALAAALFWGVMTLVASV